MEGLALAGVLVLALVGALVWQARSAGAAGQKAKAEGVVLDDIAKAAQVEAAVRADSDAVVAERLQRWTRK